MSSKPFDLSKTGQLTKQLLDTIDKLTEELTLHRETLHVAAKLLDDDKPKQARLVLGGLKSQSKLMEGRI